MFGDHPHAVWFADGCQHEEWRAQREVCFGQGDVQCVGIRYYTGVVLPGQWVRLVREPRNP